MSNGAFLYIVRCSDGSYYSGTARDGLEKRVAEHNSGIYGGYTATRRHPNFVLVFSQWFDRIRTMRSSEPNSNSRRRDEVAAERVTSAFSRLKMLAKNLPLR